MRRMFFLIILLCASSIFAQSNIKRFQVEGFVEYKSSQFLYVRFDDTEGLKVGDTLYVKLKNRFIPKLKIESLSSRSCATKPLSGTLPIKAKVHGIIEKVIDEENKSDKDLLKKNEHMVEVQQESSIRVDTTEFKGIQKMDSKFYGRFSVSSYTNISNSSSPDYQNWRYSLSLDADNIDGTNLSLSNYTVFKYRADEWNYYSTNLGRAFKIYDLAISYDLNNRYKIILGRKINNKVANIGAIDGLQAEINWDKYTFGGFVGFRPDYSDYSINTDLLQGGGYISRSDTLGSGIMQNTISVVQQMNNNNTDRRFLYFQHTNNIIDNTSFFISSELDLFKKIDNKGQSDLRFTSLYTSIRYSPRRWISASLSYDARKNVIYYETFKNYADQLIEDALRQGLRFRLNFRPVRYIFLSSYFGYRFRENDDKSTKNFGATLTHSYLPYIKSSGSINYLNIATSYLEGNIFGLRFSKDLLDGLIYGSIGYKKVNYTFVRTDNSLIQDIAQIDLSTRLYKKMILSINYEGTFEKKSSYSNIYLNLTARF